MMSVFRNEVLSIYRRILRLSRTWESKDPATNATDREYIRNEAKTLFRQNKNLQDSEAIKDRIREAEARLAIGLHYRNPYPRPVNLPPLSLALKKGKEQGVAQERMKKSARPIYIKSIDSEG